MPRGLKLPAQVPLELRNLNSGLRQTGQQFLEVRTLAAGFEHGGELRIADEFRDDLTSRATAPALDLPLIPPVMGGAEWFGHHTLDTYHVPSFLRRQQRLEVGVYFGNIIGKTVFKLHLVGFCRTPYGNLKIIWEAQYVIDGAERAKLDGSTAEPVQDLARTLIISKSPAIVETNIPSETLPGKAMSQSADVLRLFEK